jgi:hypothetical protein
MNCGTDTECKKKNILLKLKYRITTYIWTNLLKYEHNDVLFSGKPSDKFCLSQTNLEITGVSEVFNFTICINM